MPNACSLGVHQSGSLCVRDLSSWHGVFYRRWFFFGSWLMHRSECGDPSRAVQGAQSIQSSRLRFIWKFTASVPSSSNREFIQRTLHTCVSVRKPFCSRCISSLGELVSVSVSSSSPWRWRWRRAFSWRRTMLCAAVSEDVFMHSSPGPCAVEASRKVVPSDSLLSKRSSHDCGLLVFCRNMTSTRGFRSPSILSGPNCTPEASYLIHSWFHWGVLSAKKENKKKKRKTKRSLFLSSIWWDAL